MSDCMDRELRFIAVLGGYIRANDYEMFASLICVVLQVGKQSIV